MDDGLSMTMLGWKAHETMRHTLASWKQAELDKCGELFVYFNQMSAEDRAVVDEFGIRSCGSEKNLGIWGGREASLEVAKGDYILFFDNDHVAIKPPAETKCVIDASLELLKSGKADAVILINGARGWGAGDYFKYQYVRDPNPQFAKLLPTWSATWNRDTLMRKLRRFLRPDAAMRHTRAIAYFEKHPENIFPRLISREGKFLILDSSFQPYCDAPTMMSRGFFAKITAWARHHPRHRTILGFQELEYILNCSWWRKQHFKIALLEDGLFAHERLDDSWRRNHDAYNSEMK